jgi:hypothetical protein
VLWRGSRDGFRAKHFHRYCDGHAPTLTLIRDTKENLFGRFTPVEWESGKQWKADPSLKSFLFTLNSPHNLPARKFALKAGKQDKVIYCVTESGPNFQDIHVSDQCSTDLGSGSGLGDAYENDTDMRGDTVLTGVFYFAVRDIEVFEITD